MHRATHILLLASGSLWAAMLVVVGLWLPETLSRDWPVTGVFAWLVGLAAIAAGEYVFLTVVGDRLFRRASRRLIAGAELGLGAAMIMLGAAAGAALLIGERA